MRIAVVGAGAIGGWVAARLATGGQQVTVVARGATLLAIRDNGLTVMEGGESATATVTASDDPGAVGAHDLLILAVKAPALADAARWAAPLIGPETLILPMLNGVPWWFVNGEPLQSVDPGGRIAGALPVRQVIGCVVHAACSRSAPGFIEVQHAERLILGEPGGTVSERVEQLCALFGTASIRAEASANIRQAIWYKLWGNATINPLSALTRATADRLLDNAALRSFMREAMAELAEIGAAIGCPIAESGEDRMQVTARLGAFRTSMLQDVEAGRPIELDALLGAPREIARRTGIATPKLDLLCAMTGEMGANLGLL